MESNDKKKLVEYFKKNLSKNYNSETLKWALIDQGYSRTLVEFALREAEKEMKGKEIKVEKEKPKIEYQIIDEYNAPIQIKKPWWKRIFG
jgi:hypothetical protein